MIVAVWVGNSLKKSLNDAGNKNAAKVDETIAGKACQTQHSHSFRNLQS